MTSPTHDPLTPSQIALAQEIAVRPITMTIGEQTRSPRGHDLNFLSAAGYVSCTQGHVSQDDQASTWVWSRTAKPLP